MNRVDELSLKLADGSIEPEERRELERLVSENPEATRDHLAMMDLVASLRGESPAPDIADGALNRIHERISERIQIGVLSKIKVRGKERASGRRLTRRAATARSGPSPWILLPAAAGILAAIAFLFLFHGSGPEKEGEVRVVVKPTPPPERPDADRIPPAPPAPKKEDAPPPPAPESPRAPEKPAPVPVAPEKPAPPAVPEEKPPPPKPETPAEPARPVVAPTETAVVAAQLEKAEGASVLARSEKRPAKAGQDLLQGEGLEIGEAGSATLKFPDGTRLEIKARSRIRDLTAGDAKKGTGKSLEFAQGMLVAAVTEQPAGRPLTITTPQAELRILGTAFRLSVDAEADGATQLDVSEGKVRLTRLADGKSVDVPRGGSVRAAKGAAALTAQPQTGLLGHWKLDETSGTKALDSSGNLLHATLKGDAAWAPGRWNGGLKCGAAGQLSIPGLVLPDTFTLSFWVFQPALNRDQDWFLNVGGVFMLMREGNMDPRQIRLGFENPQEFLTVPSVLQAKQWTHLALSYDGTEMRLFSNGNSAGAKKMARRDIRGDASFGRVSPGSEGIFDDIRVYDHALTPADVTRVMLGASPAPARR